MQDCFFREESGDVQGYLDPQLTFSSKTPRNKVPEVYLHLCSSFSG